jgi:beta-phosphoglucomutase-like phosphatase (HAD superfamily)
VFATLLDFDGVLVDSEPVHLAAFNDVLAPYGVAIGAPEYIEKYLSLDDAGVFQTVLSLAGRPPADEEVRSLIEAKHPRFLSRFAESFRVFAGARELVERRARRGMVAIVSGALQAEIEFALDRMAVRPQIQLIVAAEQSPASKPDPGPYVTAIEELRRRGHSGGAVAVEDSVGGVRSAKGAGLRCVALTHTYTASELMHVGADACAADLHSLTDALLEG